MAKQPSKRARVKRKAKRRRTNWFGHPALTGARLRLGNRIAQVFGLTVTATTDGTHTTTSYHYQHRAEDLASWDVRKMKAAQRAIALVVGRRNITELFGPGHWYIKNGVKYHGAFPDHGDHVHLAI